MSTRRKLIISGILAVALAIGWAVTRAAAGTQLSDMFGGPSAIAVVQKPTSVKAWLVQTPNDYSKSLDGFSMRGDAVAVTVQQAGALKKVLLNDDSYLWDAAKGCAPVYGVRIEFATVEQAVDILFCFECDILTIFYNGRATGGEDFDKVRPELLKIIKPMFPDEESLQALKEQD